MPMRYLQDEHVIIHVHPTLQRFHRTSQLLLLEADMVEKRDCVSSDQVYQSAVDEAIGSAKNGTTIFTIVLTFEFGIASAIVGLLVAYSYAGCKIDSIHSLPHGIRCVGFGLILPAFFMPILAQAALLRTARRHAMARYIQTQLLKQSAAKNVLSGRVLAMASLNNRFHSTVHLAQRLLAFCATVVLFILFIWWQSSWLRQPLTYFDWERYCALVYCAIFLFHQIIWFERAAMWHLMDDGLFDTAVSSSWLAGIPTRDNKGKLHIWPLDRFLMVRRNYLTNRMLNRALLCSRCFLHLWLLDSYHQYLEEMWVPLTSKKA